MIEQTKDRLGSKMANIEEELRKAFYDEIRLTHGEDIAGKLEPAIKEVLRKNSLFDVDDIVQKIIEY